MSELPVLSETPEAKEKVPHKVFKLLTLAAIFVLLLTVIRPIMVRQSTYQSAFDYLEEKMGNATMISLGVTSSSFVISLIPDDAGSAIANELAEYSGYMLIVISAIFLERYLLTTIGFVSSSIILPLSCLFAGLAIIAHPQSRLKLKEYAFRLLIFGICIAIVIPLGCYCGRMIENANSASIQAALDDAKNANEIMESIPEGEESKNIFDKVGDFFSGLWKNAADAYSWAKTRLSHFMASVAVMLVTTIAIPILIFFCFLWLARFLTKHDFVIAFVGFADRFTGSAKKVIVRRKRPIGKHFKV